MKHIDKIVSKCFYGRRMTAKITAGIDTNAPFELDFQFTPSIGLFICIGYVFIDIEWMSVAEMEKIIYERAQAAEKMKRK